jgi:hypothetical protein
MTTTIIGAGMAGLLAANMLRDGAEIYDSAPELPNNHSAVLRFRSMVVSHATGIPFRPVQVMRAAHPWMNPIADAMAYSYKCNGVCDLRSIANADSKIVERYIAPLDFVKQMADALPPDSLRFGRVLGSPGCPAPGDVPMISTVPMSIAMMVLGWQGPKPEFRYQHGCNVVVSLTNVDAWASLYIPDPLIAASRATLMGDRLILECPRVRAEELDARDRSGGVAEDLVTQVCGMMGLPMACVGTYVIKEQRYAKIMPIDENVRKGFIMWASERHRFYSLGRFATWRPSLLLDDVVHDVRVIQQLMRGDVSPRYSARKG